MTLLTTRPDILPAGPPPDSLYEIVDGQYLELPPMSGHATVLASRLLGDLGNYLNASDLGEAVTHLLFSIKPGARRSYRPDVAFVSYSRWPKDRPWPDTDPTPVVPELAVEVVSRNDVAQDVMGKVKAYLEAGVLTVWLVYPTHGWVVAFEAGGRSRYLTQADELDGGTALPGFRLPLRELFTQSEENGETEAEPAT